MTEGSTHRGLTSCCPPFAACSAYDSGTIRLTSYETLPQTAESEENRRGLPQGHARISGAGSSTLTRCRPEPQLRKCGSCLPPSVERRQRLVKQGSETR